MSDGPVHGDAGAEDARPLLPVVRRAGPRLPASVETPVDVALGAAVTVARPVVAVAVGASRAVEPLVRVAWSLALRPPLVPESWTPAALAVRLADRGRHVRFAAGADATELGGQTLDVLVPSVLEPVLDRVDLTGLVLDRVDLERLVAAVLDRLDLTELVLDRVDLHRVVESALDSLDLTQLVRDRVDVAALAEEVVEEIDLPDIIRESSTGVAGDVVDGARLSAVAGDELVNRWIDRFLQRQRRHIHRSTGTPTPADGAATTGEEADDA
ncbi:MAG TPA: hypothetical protein VLV82_07450 [Candidatus Angelobacter sp.]|nr:hypothetical protein [Candidatus Angelobacter sp.]